MWNNLCKIELWSNLFRSIMHIYNYNYNYNNLMKLYMHTYIDINYSSYFHQFLFLFNLQFLIQRGNDVIFYLVFILSPANEIKTLINYSTTVVFTYCSIYLQLLLHLYVFIDVILFYNFNSLANIEYYVFKSRNVYI